jgi:diguanylate cyclase (GGDEF)-like protein
MVYSVLVSADGELWVSTRAGTYHGDGHQFAELKKGDDPFPSDHGQPLAELKPGRIALIKGNELFVLTRLGSSSQWAVEPYFSDADLSAHPELRKIRSIFAAPNGSLWMGCDNVVCQATGNRVKVWGPKDGVLPDQWGWILRDSGGRIWGRGFKHIVALQPGASHFDNVDIPGVHEDADIEYEPMAEDGERRILTSTGSALALWDKGHWKVIGPAQGFKTPGVYSILFESSGGLWLGCRGGGIRRWLGYGNWETWAGAPGDQDNWVPWNFLRDKRGAMWMSSETGIAQFDRGQREFLHWRTNLPVPRNRVLTILTARDGSMWFGSVTGNDNIVRYDPDTGKMKAWTIKDGWATKLRQDAQGRIWLVTTHGLFLWNPSTHSLDQVHDPTLPERGLYDTCEDTQHALWFTSTSGLHRFQAGRWTRIRFPNKDADAGFADLDCAADGTLWLATDMSAPTDHLRHLRIQGDVAIPADPKPPAELGTREVMFLRFDRRQWLWIGTGTGVYVFNGRQWRHITKNDGLAWNDCNQGAFFEDTDGSIWMGTSGGVSHVLHPERLFDHSSLRIIATDAWIGNAPLFQGRENSFAWTRAPMHVHLIASAFDNASATVYRYRLAGLAKEWTSTANPDLQFASLPDGGYSLEVYAENADFGATSPVVSIAFRVRPPWWKSLPFELLLVMLTSLIGLVILRLRERNLKRRQLELEEMVRARTAELEKEKQQLTEAREALRLQATHDPLTGLLNHGAILGVLERELKRSRREGTKVTVAVIDIDHFKRVNDEYGHLAGDRVLRAFAGRLTKSIRGYDAIGRYGGEEFLLVMPNFHILDDPERINKLHRGMCSGTIPVQDRELVLTCSMGISTSSGQEISVEELVEEADKAMYRAKQAGRNRVEIGALQPK